MPETLTLDVLDQRQQHLTRAHDALRRRLNEVMTSRPLKTDFVSLADLQRMRDQIDAQDASLKKRMASVEGQIDARVQGPDPTLFVTKREAATFLTMETFKQSFKMIMDTLEERFDKRMHVHLQPWAAVRKRLEARVKALEKAALTMSGPCGDAARQQKEQLLRVSRVTWTRAMGTEAFQ
jgi:hypothetical protein